MADDPTNDEKRRALETALATGGGIALLGGSTLYVERGGVVEFYHPNGGTAILSHESSVINRGDIKVMRWRDDSKPE